MKRRAFILTMAVGLAAAFPALAAGFSDQVVRQLRRQGYRNIVVARTLLGRTRITATRGGGAREIILNPKTGEILRDLWIAADGRSGGAGLVDGRGGGEGSAGQFGGGASRRDDDDDDGDDDDDDDDD
ncbi:MAG: hypothetical protein ACK4HF_08820 [Paracoccaceae bacterium]